MAIGKYRILRLLGSGGLGVVYLGYDPELDRRVAIKLLRPDRKGTSDSTTAKVRLLREAQAAAKLSHPNVAHVYEVGEHKEQVYLAMEFVEGKTLRKWIEAEPRPWREIVGTFSQAGTGLAAAHDAGLVHRDFKPDNVLVSDQGRAFVVDFGLATAAVSIDELETARDFDATEPDEALHATALTSTGALVGTPAYMAPEQFSGAPIDARSDQFSFCVALWEALYGQRPFGGKTVEAVARSVRDGDVRVPEHTRGVPGWVRDAVRRGLAVDPDERHPSMEVLLILLSGKTRAARVRVATVSSLALSLAAAVGWSEVADARRRADCEAEAASISDVWNTEARAAITDALVATEVTYAAETAARVGDALDKYGAGWSRVREQACLAARDDDASTRRLAEASEHCLEIRRDSLRQYLEIVSEADASMVQRAVGASQALPPVSQCEDTGWLLTQERTPDDERTRDAVRELEPRLTQAWSFENAGRFDEAFETVAALAPAAEATGYMPFIAEVQTQLGTVQARRGHPKESRAALERGFYAALESGDDLSAAEAATELVWTVGYELREYDRSLEWADVAASLLERLGEPDGVQMAALLDTAGCVRDIMGDPTGSAQDLVRALKMRLRAFGPEHQLVAVALGNLGLAHYSLGNMDAALEYREHALGILERNLGSDHPFTAEALNGVSVMQLEQGNFDQALAGFRRALRIRQTSLGPDHPHTAQAKANVANVLQELGRLDEAYEMQRQVLSTYEIAYGNDDPQMSSGLLNLGSVEIDLGKFADATAHLQRTLKIREAHYPPGHPGLHSTRYYLGVAKHGVGDFTGAVELLRAVLDDETAPIDLRESARFHLGRAQYDLGNHTEAVALVRAAYDTRNDGRYHRGAKLSEIEQWLAGHDDAGVEPR